MKSRTSVIYLGLLPAGFETLPSEKYQYYDRYNKNKKAGEVDILYVQDSGITRLIYLAHGFIGANKRGDTRGGRNLGFSIELNGLELSEELLNVRRNDLTTFLSSFFSKALLDKNSTIVKSVGSSKQFVINNFDEQRDYLETIGSVLLEQFFNRFSKDILEYDKDSNRNLDLSRSGIVKKEIPTKISDSLVTNGIVKHHDSINHHSLNEIERTLSAQRKLNWISFPLILFLLLLSGYNFYNNLKSESEKSSNLDTVEVKVIGEVFNEKYLFSKKTNDGKIQYYLKSNALIKSANFMVQDFNDVNEFVNDLSNFLISNSSYVKNRFSNSEELLMFIKQNNLEDIKKLNSELTVQQADSLLHNKVLKILGNDFLISQD